MTRLIRNILILIVLVIVGDCLIGHALQQAYRQTTNDKIGRLNYICDSVNAEIIVLGSSRALHHYVPRLITDSTGLSCYNCGFEGEGIVFHYALLRQLQQRYRPRLIIYELTYDYDIQYLPWRPAKLTNIRPMSGLQCRDSILCSVDPWESVAMLSHIFPYNSKLFNILFSQQPTEYDSPTVDNGYIPQFKVLSEDKFQGIYYLKHDENIDSLKVGYLKKLINENRDRLMVVVSPRFRSPEDNIYGMVEQMCRNQQVPFYCTVTHPVISRDITLWEDDGHLNDKGAQAFTSYMIPFIKQKLLANHDINNIKTNEEN